MTNTVCGSRVPSSSCSDPTRFWSELTVDISSGTTVVSSTRDPDSAAEQTQELSRSRNRLRHQGKTNRSPVQVRPVDADKPGLNHSLNRGADDTEAQHTDQTHYVGVVRGINRDFPHILVFCLLV